MAKYMVAIIIANPTGSASDVKTIARFSAAHSRSRLSSDGFLTGSSNEVLYTLPPQFQCRICGRFNWPINRIAHKFTTRTQTEYSDAFKPESAAFDFVD
jgi:hypothetical protein